MLDIQLTGTPGNTMKESVQYALKLAWSLLPLKIQNKIIKDANNKKSFGIHIHCPDAATPKDGPSAGITMATALTSAIAGIPVRQDVAMTGEISLRGRVLPIGGLKEKILAAKQAGITTVIIPEKNRKDIAKIPDEIKNGIEIRPVSDAEEVLKIALNLSKPEEFMKTRALKVLDGDANLEVAN